MKIGKGTAVISIKEYDELRRFKKDILDGKTIKVTVGYIDYEFSSLEITDEMKKIEENNHIVQNTNSKLHSKIENLEYKIDSQRTDILRLKSELEEAKKDTFWKWLTRK